MRSLRNLSINTKLSLLVTLAVCIAISLCGGAFLVHEFVSTRAHRVEHDAQLAEEFDEEITQALASNDSPAADELLSSLRIQQSIEFAAIYDARGHVFATYGEPIDDDLTEIIAGPDGHAFSAGEIGRAHV